MASESNGTKPTTELGPCTRVVEIGLNCLADSSLVHAAVNIDKLSKSIQRSSHNAVYNTGKISKIIRMKLKLPVFVLVQ